jgi:hypothetical protein
MYNEGLEDKTGPFWRWVSVGGHKERVNENEYGGCILYSYKKIEASHQWLMPVILYTQGADIRRILVQSQPWQIVSQDHISKKPSQK